MLLIDFVFGDKVLVLFMKYSPCCDSMLQSLNAMQGSTAQLQPAQIKPMWEEALRVWNSLPDEERTTLTKN